MNLDSASGRTLAKILLKSELNRIPADILKKIETFCNSRYEELITTKTLYNSMYNKCEKLRKDAEKLSSNTQGTDDKTNAAQINITELRRQLGGAYSEIERLNSKVTQHESETISYRKERNDIIVERDQLQNSLDRNNATLQRLQSDIKNLEKKLETVVSEKSSALADMVTKEQALDYKQKQLERERERLNNEIIILKKKFKDSTTELLALRHGNISDSGQLEAELKQKTDDLLKANTTICQLIETNRLLTNQNEQHIEEMEDIKNQINMQCYGAKISSYEKQLQDAEQLQRADKELFAMCLKQKERYKQLYYDAIKDICEKPPSGIEVKRASEIEKILQDKIKQLQEEYDNYRSGSSGNFELLNDQLKEMQNKVKELISANCKLSTHVNFANEKIKNRENDIIAYKKQIQTLEERNQMYDKIIGKHELSIKHLRNETLDTIKKLSAAENQCEYLQEECRRLINARSNLERENQSFHRQNLTHRILQSDLEMMKLSSERLQFEGRLQMEKQLDKVTRECSDLHHKLDEEQNHRLSDDAASFKRLADSAVKKMENEKAQAEMLRSEIKEERKQIELKNEQINDLSKKLQEALTRCKFDDPNKKIKDLEVQMELFPLQEKNLEVSTKAEEQHQIIINMQSKDVETLEMDEESKQLQYERDNLATMFTTEVPLNDKKEDSQNEFSNLKLTNLRLTEEITELKSNISKKDEKFKAIQDELSNKDAELVDTNKKEIQIRIIAKKYKNSYLQLKSKYDVLATKCFKEQIKASISGNVSDAARVETERAQANKKDDLSSHLKLALFRNEIIRLRKMNKVSKEHDSGNVSTTQGCGDKRPRGADVSTEYCSEEECASPQNKRTRLGEQKFHGGTVCDLHYQLPTSSQRDEDDIMDAKVKNDDIENGITGDAEIDSRNEVESLDQHKEHDIYEYNVRNDTSEVEVHDSSDAPNSSFNAASSGTRENLTEAMEASPLSQETRQIQMISSGNDADQENTWRQVQRQKNLIIQEVCDEIGEDSTVPSTPTLYVARRADSEAVSSSHHIVVQTFERTDDMRMNEESDDGGQNSPITASVLHSDHQEIVVIHLADESSKENKEAGQNDPVTGVSGQAEGTVPQIMVTNAENAHNGSGASILQKDDNKNVSVALNSNDEDDGVSFEGKKLCKQDEIQVEENREAVALIQPMVVDNQGSNPIVCDEEIRGQQMSSQHHVSAGRAARKLIVRGSRETLSRTSRS